MKKLVTLVSAAVVALLGVTAAQPTSSSGGVRTLRTPAVVTGLAVDGSLAAVATTCGPPRDFRIYLYAWNPARRSAVSVARRRERECYGASGGEGIWEVAIGGPRLAWVRFGGGNYTEAWLVTATTGRPRSTAPLTGTKVSNTDSGLGDWVGNVHGDGSLLVFNTWSVCEADSESDYACPAGVPPGIYDENLWRIVGARKRLLVSSPDELTVLSVAAGRILVQRADGSLELRRGDGSLLRAFPFRRGEVRAALLDASELVVLDRASSLTWRVYDPVSGEQKRVLPAARGAVPQDVERGLLVYTIGRVVHVLRIADGRQKAFVAPVVKMRGEYTYVSAQIEPSGLYYSYQVRLEGRVRFVPFGEIRFR